MASAGTLKHWLQYATPEDRAKLAEMAGTSEAYLFNQLANGHRENPKLRLALAIAHGSRVLVARSRRRLPEITLAGLAWPEGRD